jgi:AcrR family transcriptional regulator
MADTWQSHEKDGEVLSAATTRNRAALIRSAQQVLAEIGPDATVGEFVAHAQVSPTTIYNHFGSKEAMFAQALAQLWREWIEWAHSDGPPDGSLEEMIDVCRKLFRAGETHPEFSKILGNMLHNPTFVIDSLRSETLPAFEHVASSGNLTQFEFENRTRLFIYCFAGIAHGVHATKELSPADADAALEIALAIWNVSPELAKALTSRPLDI